MIKVKAFLKGQSSSSGSGGPDVESSTATANNNKNGFVVIDTQNGNSVGNTNNEEMIESTDELFLQLRSEAIQVVKNEPMLTGLLSKVGLLDNTTLASIPTTTTQSSVCNISPAKTFEEVISRIVAHRLSSCSGGSEGNVCPQLLLHQIHESFKSTELELGHTMSDAVRADAVAVVRRDPACETLLEVVLFMKGFASLVIHRAARRAWKPNNNNNGGGAGASRRFSALLLQSLASSAFGVDIHPAAEIGAGVMFDHASGIVIGETAVIGDGTTILHGVTLGGTGKENGDRHPKVGNDVLIGAGTKILGNIRIGDRVKIGAGSVVLRPIPTGATAVGAPARIIGFTPKGEKPGSFVDSRLRDIEPLLGVADSLVGTTITKSTTDTSLSTATTEMQAISEGQSESSSSDVIEGSDGDDGSGEKITVVPKKKNDINGPIKSNDEEPDEKDDQKYEEEDDGDDEDDKTKDDDMCPFSGTFKKCPRALSEDWISHPKLRSLLMQKGCSESECIEVFFELLHLLPPDSKARLCGCIPADVFAKNIVDVAQEKTSLDLETCQALANGDLLVLGLNKKASKRFKCFFVKVAKNSARALSRISSASDLLSSSRRESILGNDSERATTS